MKSTINYYYNLNPDKINQIFNYYYFYIDNELYYLKIFCLPKKMIDSIYKLNHELIDKNVIVNEIINNRDYSIITFINNIPYILTKICININKRVSLSEISYLSNIKVSYYKELMRGNWISLWMNKIDYLEYHYEQNYYQYPLLSECFNYFIGLSENAIMYLQYTISVYQPESVDIGVISHDFISIDDTIYALYDPQNIIIDHKARDLGEYIKNSFFQDNFNIFDELDQYFKYNYFSIYGIHLLMARILYPSFCFNAYEAIVNKEMDESYILNFTSRINEYEDYLLDIWHYFHKYYDIQDIEWLSKKNK